MANYRKIELRAVLTYDADMMHGDDPDSLEWFDAILRGDDLQLADFGNLGDVIGSIKIVDLS